jgi:DNA-binding winged helix-turn-helix (wHTH) protein
MLLENPGQTVTREELHQRLWPKDTFVDFDHGLNNAINRLRESMCDSAENPRYIETLPRRGYRFIAQVELTELGIDSPSTQPATVTVPPAKSFRDSLPYRYLWIVVALIVVASTVGGFRIIALVASNSPPEIMSSSPIL